MAMKDLTPIGARFHLLTVVGEPISDRHNIWHVKCFCDCGGESFPSCRQLVSGQSKSCGCLRAKVARDYAIKQVERGAVAGIHVGARFGMLTVIDVPPINDGAKRKARCLCDCGVECLVPVSGLRAKTKSCGCLAGILSRQNRRPAPIGIRFGRLVVQEEIERSRFHRMVVAKCDCGNSSTVCLPNLLNGHTTSCGCHKLEMIKAGGANLSHGHSRRGRPERRTYSIWHDMKNRCRNPKYPEFHLYGGRGIKVCDQWIKYTNFLADMGEAPAGLTIERKDVDGDYEPGNCRWATVAEQMNNKRNNVIIQYDGRRQTVAQWARELGVDPFPIYRRVSKGLAGGRALGLHGKNTK